MRILIPTQFFIDGSGSGIYVQNIAREFQSMGHEVLVISAENASVTGKSYPVSSIIFNPKGGKDVDLDFNVPYFTTHPQSNQTFYALTADQYTSYVRVLGEHLRREIEAFKPDVVHCQHASIFASHLAEMNIPYAITIHGTDLMGFKKEPRFHDAVLRGVKGAWRLISISNQVTADTMATFSMGKDRIVLMHNGYDERLFYPRNVTRKEVLARYGIDHEPPALVSFVGKLAHFKGIDVLMRAAVLYEKKIPGAITLIVGQGQLRGELEAQVKALGLNGVHFLGHQTQDAVADIYSVADVSTVPSRQEPFGLVAIEALACGTPVVGTNGGGLPDFIDDRVGKLVPLEDATALGETIAHEIQSSSKKTKGPYAAAYAREGFSWRVPVAKMLAIFEEAIKHHQAKKSECVNSFGQT